MVEVVDTVVTSADEGTNAIVHIDGVTLPKNEMSIEELSKEGKIDSLVAAYVTPTNYANASSATVTVTVNDVAVTYKISLNK